MSQAFFLLLFPLASAGAEFRYEWTKPELNSRSVCVLVDQATGGKKQKVLVEDQFCKKPETIFAWSKPEFGFDSRCEELDVEHGGENYRRSVNASHCLKPATVHLWLKPEGFPSLTCLEVDRATHGKVFRIRAADRLCPMVLDMNAAFPKPEPYVSELADGEPAVNQEKRVKAPLGREFESNPLFWEDLLPEKKR